MSAQASILDRDPTLAEVFEPELFTELSKTWVDLYRVGLRVFDADHNKLVDVQFGAGLFNYVFGLSEARGPVTQFITSLKSMEVDPGEWRWRDEALTGTRWLIAPLVYQGDLLGKVVVGPYLAAESEAIHRPGSPLESQLDRARFDRLRGELRRVADTTLRKIVENLLKTVEVVCHAGYKALLTSNMHLESITSAYDALETKNRQLEDRNTQLVLNNDRLRELDALKSNFLATVSHELRTPLTSVIGYSEMLLEGLAGPLSGEQREYVATIMEKGESLLHLISGILDISKLERGGAPTLSLTRTRPEHVVDTALSTLRPTFQKAEVRLEVSVAEALPDLWVDPHKIRQVLQNLLSNAAKFTPSGGHVRVRVEASPDATDTERRWVEFSVADNGIGIPPEHRDRIFDAFYQVDNSSTREFGGTGLGLSIAQSFIEAHGGSLRVESAVGEGSTFTFTVPTALRGPS
jgi:signal transduction histidine kinase